MGCAFGAPADVAVAGVGYAGLGLAGVHGLGYAGVHGLGYAAAPAAVSVAAAPIAYGAEHYTAGPVVPHAPAPYTPSVQAAGVYVDFKVIVFYSFFCALYFSVYRTLIRLLFKFLLSHEYNNKNKLGLQSHTRF